MERVASFRAQYALLTQTQDVLSPGKMLLMGFNGLFEKLSQEMHNLIDTVGNLEVPASWKKLDQIKEAKNISAHITNSQVARILDDIFLLKRIKAITDFFGSALEMCQSFKATGKCIVYTDEKLSKPVKQFIADFISRQLLGMTTEAVAYAVCFLLQHLGLNVSREIEQRDIGAESKVPLDELCHKAWNFFLKSGRFSQNLISQASSFSSNLKTAWDKIQGPKKIEMKLAVLQSSALRLQNQLTVYNFMYEEILSQLRVYTSIRNKFIVDLRNEVTTLTTSCVKLGETREKQQVLIENAHQRLNWAKGANPDVIEISAAFEAAIAERDARFDREKLVGDRVLSVCGTILQHEQLRTHCTETTNYDKLFLNTFEKWRIACQYSVSRNDAITPTEESIMNLLGGELLQNPKWLQDAAEIISDMIELTQKKVKDDKCEQFCSYDAVQIASQKFTEVYDNHCRLMSDVKSLIKSMSKFDDFSEITQEFMSDYRRYTDYFNNFSATCRKNEMSEFEASINHLKHIAEETEDIYERLLGLEGGRRGRPLLVRQDGVDNNKGQPQKQESSNKGQQRNAYAVGVWRRIKMKLEGRDPDPGRKYSPQEQVDHVIREATSLDNLALLYEGWTPWV